MRVQAENLLPDWTARVALAIAVALFLLLFGRVLFAPSGHAPATGDSDFYMYYLPMTEMAFGQLRKGTLPVWNPYLFSGMPLLASIEIGVLYPPNWLHLVLPSDRAFCLLYVFHVLLAAAGSWWLARGRGRSNAAAVLSALAFAFAAPTILHFDMGMVTVVYSSAWFPLILALTDRSIRHRTAASACGLTLALACQFLAGFPMFTLLLAAIAPAWVLVFGVQWRRPLLSRNANTALFFIAVAVLAVGLVMPQLLPTLRYLNHSVRGRLGYQQATHCCLPAPNLITFLVPEFFGNGRDCSYWGETFLFDATAYCGATTILLALLAAGRWRTREFRFWGTTVVLVLGLALGKYSYIYDFGFTYIPGVDRFRGMARLSIFAILGLSQLAGMGLDDVVQSLARKRIRWCCLGTGVLSAVALALCAVVWSDSGAAPTWWDELFTWVRRPGTELFTSVPPHLRPQFLADSFRVMLHSAMSSAAVLLVASVVAGLHGWWKWTVQITAPTLLLLLATELFAFDSKYVVLMDPTPFRGIANRVLAALPDDGELYRVAGFSANPPLVPNRLLYGGLQSVGGHENFILSRYSLFVEFCTGIGPDRQTNLTVPNFDRVYDLLNVKYFLVPPDMALLEPGDELIRENVFEFCGHRFALYRNRNCLPRLLLVHQARIVPDFQAAVPLLEKLYQGSVQTDTFIESSRPIKLAPVNDAERARENVSVIEYSPGRIVADVRCAAPALLLCTSNYYPSWKATVDGQDAPVLPANIYMRAVPVPAGDHRVELMYRPADFATGCRFAGLSLASMLGMVFWSYRPARWRRCQVRLNGNGRACG